jgi:drug/metabolite transporter (DMT)-like permease
MWFILALIAGIFFAINSLMIRYYFKKHHDEWIFSFFFSFGIMLLFLPFFIYYVSNFGVSIKDIYFWIGMLLIGIMLVINNILGFKASKIIGATTQNVVGKLKLLWIIIAGLVIFNEVITIQKIIGMILIICASFLIIDYSNWKASRKGIIFIIVAGIASAIYGVLLKETLLISNIITVSFFACVIPAIFNALLTPNFFNSAKKVITNKQKVMWIASICCVGGIANIAMIKALSYDVLAGVYFVMDASLIVIIFGEHFLLKERERLWWKASALVLAIIGAILIHGI